MATGKEIDERRKWHVERSVPLAFLGAIALQTLVGTWWMSSFQAQTVNRLDTLETRQKSLDLMPERMAKQEAVLQSVLSAVQDIRTDQRDANLRRTK